jgi:sodium-dependent dicarboxylate transporter 2/3/5
MSWGVPVVVLMVPAMAMILARNLRGPVDVDLPHVGRWRPEEKRVMAVFALTALAWITRGEPFGGWSSWLGLPQANDASVALLAVLCPARHPFVHSPGTRDPGPQPHQGLDPPLARYS